MFARIFGTFYVLEEGRVNSTSLAPVCGWAFIVTDITDEGEENEFPWSRITIATDQDIEAIAATKIFFQGTDYEVKFVSDARENIDSQAVVSVKSSGRCYRVIKEDRRSWAARRRSLPVGS